MPTLFLFVCFVYFLLFLLLLFCTKGEHQECFPGHEEFH